MITGAVGLGQVITEWWVEVDDDRGRWVEASDNGWVEAGDNGSVEATDNRWVET